MKRIVIKIMIFLIKSWYDIIYHIGHPYRLLLVWQMLSKVEVCTWKMHRKLGSDFFWGCGVDKKSIKKESGFSWFQVFWRKQSL